VERRIICAGSVRSGSTWQFNAVRFLYEAAGQVCYGAWIEDYDSSRDEKVHVLKTHMLPLLVRHDIVLTSYRDLRDVVASYVRMGWLDSKEAGALDRFLDNYVVNLDVLCTEARHVMRFEAMMDDPTAELVHLSRSLELVLDTDAIEGVRRRIDELRPATDAPAGTQTDYDPETQLHAGHMGRSSLALNAVWKSHIEKRYWRWLRRHGYIVAGSSWRIEDLAHTVRLAWRANTARRLRIPTAK